ncbi:hypothetical protein ACN38_g879 [Penicillium nordicum]|uniref:Uncharacterized protein n=1 Tax=Penicillium nordicum TaxID=229535 RepID=A0A0N0S006_9EURO|nr:hypothetical protein ACN38_g879 [Penicillium nordicum]
MTQEIRYTERAILTVVPVSSSSVPLAFDITRMRNESSQTDGEIREGAENIKDISTTTERYVECLEVISKIATSY